MPETSQRPPSIPPGLKLYAVGDIHGRLDLLDTLLAMIAADAAAWPAERAMLVFLGDYVDRGPDSRGVIDRLTGGLPAGFEAVCLRGNHEDMTLNCLDAADGFEVWAQNGGLATMRSYGVPVDAVADPRGLDAPRLLAQFARSLPPPHRDFLRRLPLSREIGDYFFVHAGVRPGVPLAAQSPRDLTFIRAPFLNHEGDFGKIVVHGHTPVEAPEIRPNRIGIDTGAFFSGRLTALCLEGESRRFLATGG